MLRRESARWVSSASILSKTRFGDSTEACLVLTSTGSTLDPATRARFRHGCRGSFFPDFLGGHIGQWLSLVRGQFAPTVPVQKIVGRCQCDLATEAFVQCLLNLTLELESKGDLTRLTQSGGPFRTFDPAKIVKYYRFLNTTP